MQTLCRILLLVCMSWRACVVAAAETELPAIRLHPYVQQGARQLERDRMVDNLLELQWGAIPVKDPRVIRAMRHVPRHLFIPEDERDDAYRDSPVPIGYGQTISQPYIVALMTELAQITPGMRVLEIGTGSGYQAAILYELTDAVFTIEIIAPLARRMQRLLGELKLDAIHTREGDGYYGWQPPATFDRILVTAAASHIPAPLLKQLNNGGRMVIPVGPRWGNQELMLVTKESDGNIRTRSLLPVRFVPLTGGDS